MLGSKGTQLLLPDDDDRGAVSIEEERPLPPPTQQRSKRWAARSKTGCKTCRSRHVKCDEKRPVCKQCILSKRECIGYAYGTPAGSSSTALSLSSAPPQPSKGLAPNDWSTMEAARYYVDVIVPMHIDEFKARFGSDYDPKVEFRKGGLEPWSFQAGVLQHRISCGCAAVGVAPAFGSVPGMKHLWYLLYERIGMTLKNLNEYIEVGRRPSWILYQTVNILQIEVGLSMPTWRAHAEGMAALIKGYGGMENLREMPRGAFTWVQLGLVLATACNSTSPAGNQIVGVADWSRNQVLLAYSFSPRVSLPCPTDLFFELIEITRLRAAVHTGRLSRTQVYRRARKMAEAVGGFNPETWTETSYSVDGATCKGQARLFKAAVSLYAILSLPPRLTKLFVVSLPPPSSSPDSSITPSTEVRVMSPREYYTAQLFQLCRECWNTLERESMGWPMAVLGVAVTNSPSQQDQLVMWLNDLCWIEGSLGGPRALLPLLVEFWASGKAQWDDCFYKPINVLV